MSAAIIISRRGRDGTLEPIPLTEWVSFVTHHADLRVRVEDYFAVNPKTREKLRLPVGQADSEVLIDGNWLPFLRFDRGVLITEFQNWYEDPNDHERKRIGSVARELGAVITTDAGDGTLSW